MDEEELRRALSTAPVEGDAVSATVRAAMASARRQQSWRRSAAAFAVAVVTGAALWFGYDLARAVLPPIGDGGGGGLLWIPLGVAAAIVVAVASAALAAIGRRG